MTEPTLELCERVIEAWSERISLDGDTPAHWDAYQTACRTLSERLRVNESSVSKHTAMVIIAALNVEEVQGYTLAMGEVGYGDIRAWSRVDKLPLADVEKKHGE